MRSLRHLTLGLAALLLLVWLYERRVRRETGMLRFEAEPTPEWHPGNTTWTADSFTYAEGEAL